MPRKDLEFFRIFIEIFLFCNPFPGASTTGEVTKLRLQKHDQNWSAKTFAGAKYSRESKLPCTVMNTQWSYDSLLQ
jgi:hypothetical protein